MTIKVKGYTRKDGVKVKGYTKGKPTGRNQYVRNSQAKWSKAKKEAFAKHRIKTKHRPGKK